MIFYKNKVALITGGASGIGKALSESLANYGSKVIVADKNIEAARKVAEKIRRDGGYAWEEYLDVTQEKEFRNLLEKIREKHQRLDILVNNAGIAIVGEMRDMAVDDWRAAMDVNFNGVLYGTLNAYKMMIKQGFGHIVNIGSVAGIADFPVESSFCVSKSAVIKLSANLRNEAAAFGVKVSVVCPLAVKTPMFDNFVILNAKREKFLSLIFYKLADVDECAQAILNGIKRNKAYIVFPFYMGKMILLMHRFLPQIWNLMNRYGLMMFRKIRMKN